MTEEQKVKTQICEWLALQARYCVFWVNPNARVRYQHKYYRNGRPDIEGIWKGKPLFIEVKKKSGGVISMDQMRFHNEVKSAGAIAIFAESVEDVQNELRRHG